MDSIELKILGQPLRLKVAENEDKQYYQDIAEELTVQMNEVLSKAVLKSEINAAVRVAYKLMLENKQLKQKLSCYDAIDSRIDDLIKKFDS